MLRYFKSLGIFCVGLDINTHWELNSQNAALGVYPVDNSLIEKLPVFDCVFLLSVHHQWVKTWGDARTKQIVKKLSERAEHMFFIEFSALAGKYGYEENEFFLENDEDSVVKYATEWLHSAGMQGEYLGRTRELPRKEPYRYMFCSENKGLE